MHVCLYMELTSLPKLHDLKQLLKQAGNCIEMMALDSNSFTQHFLKFQTCMFACMLACMHVKCLVLDSSSASK